MPHPLLGLFGLAVAASATKSCTWIQDTDFRGGAYAPAAIGGCRYQADGECEVGDGDVRRRQPVHAGSRFTSPISRAAFVFDVITA